MTTDSPSVETLDRKIVSSLEKIYPDTDHEMLARQCLQAIGDCLSGETPPLENLWSEHDCLLITYGNSIREPGSNPLVTLQACLHNQLQGVFSAVHVLPFFPHSSDAGFAVIDYTQVDPEPGNWEDINALARHFKLMAD